jgi:hypothetical protein
MDTLLAWYLAGGFLTFAGGCALAGPPRGRGDWLAVLILLALWPPFAALIVYRLLFPAR